MRNAFLAVIIAAITLLSVPSPAPTAVIGDFDNRIVNANNDFGFKLFGRLTDSTPTKNVFISPSSIAFALAMTLNGADGETKDAMVAALSLSEMTLEEVNSASAGLMNTLLSADEEVELSIANSLWARKGVHFLPDFIRTNRDHYDAEVTALDFDSPQAAPWINTWVSNKTQGKITDIVDDPIDPMTIMFLLNAIYFKAAWTEPFDPECTREEDFLLLTGETKRVQRMHLFHDFRYLETESFQAVSLPYASERLSMYVFLPDETTGLPAFQEKLTRENWEQWMAEFTYREGFLGLPRFKVEYGARLNSALTALGMGVAFDQNLADFSLMADTEFPIYISQVKHKTFIDLDEYGTEAAAVTMVEMALGAAPMEDEPEPFEMIVDRPFVIAIRDNTTGALLFLGCIVEP